jgi:membrane associated rhomboid family serine protease
LDLNHIFLFIAAVSPLPVLVKAWRPGGVFRGWRVAAIIVLAITGISWSIVPSVAGYVGGGAWFLLLFLPAVGLRKAVQLADAGRYQSAVRLTAFLQCLHPTAQVREQLRIFRALSAGHGSVQKIQAAPDQDRRGLRGAPAVLIFILLNVAVFGVELWRGAVSGPTILQRLGAISTELWRGALTNPTALHRLGALDLSSVRDQGEFWRLLSALFLHYNVLHLIFNLFALYVVGPPLEKIIGSFRFAAAYLISGIGSTAGVIALTQLGKVHPAELVGASGSVMGIVGAWAGFLVRHRHIWQAKQRLLNILMIIVIQLVFDISTPQVSTSAHLCGLVSGFLLGLYLAPRKTVT